MCVCFFFAPRRTPNGICSSSHSGYENPNPNDKSTEFVNNRLARDSDTCYAVFFVPTGTPRSIAKKKCAV